MKSLLWPPVEVSFMPWLEMIRIGGAASDVRPSVAAEFLFQVIAELAEKAAVILTTNLPFSEWTQVIPNARLCKALLDRITDRAHIVETGTDSYLSIRAEQ